MRIAVVETSSRGGLLHYAAQLADALAAAGHEVDLVVPRRHERLGPQDPPAGPRARRVPVLVPPTPADDVVPAGRARRVLRRGLIAQRLTRSLVRATWQCARGRYDVVVLQWEILFRVVSVASHVLLSLPGRPRVAFVLHNVRPFDRWGSGAVHLEDARVDARMKRLLPRFDLVVVHGEQSRAEYQRQWPPTRLAVIAHGDERMFVSEPQAPSPEARALFFGAWHTVKGLPVLMEAFDRVAAVLPEARLTIAGAPAPADFDDEVVRRWAAAHADRVELVPRYVEMDEVPALFGAARVVVTPYLAGYQSGVVHLAMTMGRAVVCSDVGDLPEVVGAGDCGLVVPAGDGPALAAALVRVLGDQDLAAGMGQRGRRRMTSTSSWESTARDLSTELLALVQGRSRPPAG